MLPSIGVVVPTRNRPGLLRRTLAAIAAQDYLGKVRTVVVYDQSPPDPDLRGVKVLTNSRTAGLAGARNTGILALDTDLIAFCDDDDEWAPDKLTAQVAVLEPDIDVTTCAIEVRYRDRLVPRLAGLQWVGLDQLIRSRMAMLHASTFLVRRAALLDPQRLGLVAEDAPGSQNEDWDLLLRAARRGPIRHLDRPLVRVRWGTTSHYAYEYATKISSLRWMMNRHPEIAGCPPGAGRCGTRGRRCATTGASRAPPSRSPRSPGWSGSNPCSRRCTGAAAGSEAEPGRRRSAGGRGSATVGGWQQPTPGSGSPTASSCMSGDGPASGGPSSSCTACRRTRGCGTGSRRSCPRPGTRYTRSTCARTATATPRRTGTTPRPPPRISPRSG